MGQFTTYVEQRILGDLSRVAPFTPPATLYLALTTIPLTRTDATMPLGVEMNGSGYARKLVPNDATMWSAATFILDADGQQRWTFTNLLDVTFANATSNWPQLPGWAFLDDPLGSANVLLNGAFANQTGFALSGQTPTVAAGDITVDMGLAA